jgi:hypothetical protein
MRFVVNLLLFGVILLGGCSAGNPSYPVAKWDVGHDYRSVYDRLRRELQSHEGVQWDSYDDIKEARIWQRRGYSIQIVSTTENACRVTFLGYARLLTPGVDSGWDTPHNARLVRRITWVEDGLGDWNDQPSHLKEQWQKAVNDVDAAERERTAILREHGF